MISHWDEAETDRAELGHLSAAWTDLASATDARGSASTDPDHPACGPPGAHRVRRGGDLLRARRHRLVVAHPGEADHECEGASSTSPGGAHADAGPTARRRRLREPHHAVRVPPARGSLVAHVGDARALPWRARSAAPESRRAAHRTSSAPTTWSRFEGVFPRQPPLTVGLNLVRCRRRNAPHCTPRTLRGARGRRHAPPRPDPTRRGRPSRAHGSRGHSSRGRHPRH